MKLGKLPDKDPVERKPLGMRQSTWNHLEQYQKLYAIEHGEEIKLGDLTEQMLQSFMTADKDFQKFLKDGASTAGAAATA
jgi:hypothetical protein